MNTINHLFTQIDQPVRQIVDEHDAAAMAHSSFKDRKGIQALWPILTGQEFGLLVKALRKADSLSQAKLAELSGLSLRTIQHAESGEVAGYRARRAIVAALFPA